MSGQGVSAFGEAHPTQTRVVGPSTPGRVERERQQRSHPWQG